MGLGILLAIGMLLCGFGATIMCTGIPFTSWDASSDETKDAFRTMLKNSRFRVGGISCVVGLLILLGLVNLIMP